MIVLPDTYIYAFYLRKWFRHHIWKQLLWWLPTVVMLVYTIKLALDPNFVPSNSVWLTVYLFLFGLLIASKIVFSLCSLIGLVCHKLFKSKHNWGNLLGFILSLFVIYICIYGFTLGFSKLKITHINLTFSTLPKSFDGYKIVQFSDAHVGSYQGSRYTILQKAIDSINSQHADMIVFTGDLQNIEPSELTPCQSLLSSLHAKDGVFSVLGNHDYSLYITAPADVKYANEQKMITLQQQMGWKLLRNEHRTLHRGIDSIVIAGEENDGLPPFPAKGNIKQTLHGVATNTFVVMLQHDPTAWRRNILKESTTQLTLCGHTHGGQFSILGMRPTQLIYKEDYGVYHEGERVLNVSCGLGGLIPFRFGIPGEIVVITLHSAKK